MRGRERLCLAAGPLTGLKNIKKLLTLKRVAYDVVFTHSLNLTF